MKITKLIAAASISVVIGQSTLAHEQPVPVMEADEIVLATQGLSGSENIAAGVLVLIFLAAVLSAASAAAPAPIPPPLLPPPLN